MNEKKPSNSLKKCIEIYKRGSSISFLSMLYPIPILILVFWWFSNQFSDRLGDYLILVILGLFAISQLLTQMQWLVHWKCFKKAKHTLDILETSGESLDIDQAEEALLTSPNKSSIKELLLTWFHLARIGDTSNMEGVLKNSTERADVRNQKELSVHIYINRVTMKLGFIGTLYGLVLTFAPMKRAILALNEVEGEASFIKDIASAIDGDEYAIFSTLIATALTLVVELFNIQMLERVSTRHDVARSYLLDWNMTALQPLVSTVGASQEMESKLLDREEELRERREKLLIDKGLLLDKESLQNQKITQQLKELGVAVERSEAQLDDLAEVQDSIGRRVGELKHLEKQYKSFQHLRKGIKNSTDVDKSQGNS
jgi:hypothetical protein